MLEGSETLFVDMMTDFPQTWEAVSFSSHFILSLRPSPGVESHPTLPCENCLHECRRIQTKSGLQTIKCGYQWCGQYRPTWNFWCNLSLANTRNFSMTVMNHILFAHTRLVPVIATIIKHIYLVAYRGHRDDVGGSSRVGPLLCTLVWMIIFNITHCCREITCSTEHPFLGKH